MRLQRHRWPAWGRIDPSSFWKHKHAHVQTRIPQALAKSRNAKERAVRDILVVCGLWAGQPGLWPRSTRTRGRHTELAWSLSVLVRAPRGCDRNATRMDIGLPSVVVRQHDDDDMVFERLLGLCSRYG
ncbi:hypothetical protein CKAH01_07002 [Colletotrichum kahawae]|uniref:Uncharacterized protein n=1 Tax=Colletotrichum kahawae TaxID=34407 RepID=A0AAD9Y5A0_COLKA|nr:hypothetical protein CKAH01_07002 [Colletotrichum kahawae]